MRFDNYDTEKTPVDIMREWLEAHGFRGLYYERDPDVGGDCSCSLECLVDYCPNGDDGAFRECVPAGLDHEGLLWPAKYLKNDEDSKGW